MQQSTGEAAAATMTEAGKTLEGSEAELVLLPLRLAFETKQAKFIEPALDCLHVSAPVRPFICYIFCPRFQEAQYLMYRAFDTLQKLISYGHLEGEAGLSGGKNEFMLTELFNMVCRSSEDGATGTNEKYYIPNSRVVPLLVCMYFIVKFAALHSLDISENLQIDSSM